MIKPAKKAQFFYISLMTGGLLALSAQASAACLIKQTLQGGIPVPSALMIAPEAEVPFFLGRGFARVECPKDLTVYRAYVDRLCDDKKAAGKLLFNTVALLGRNRSSACSTARAGLVESSK